MSDTNTEPEPPPFLTLQEYHMSKVKARDAVVDLLKRCDVERPKKGWDDLKLTWNDDNERSPNSFTDLVNEMRRTGVIARLQRYLDNKDPVFGGTFEEMCTPNIQLTVTSEYAGWKKQAQGPCRTSCVEQELMEDILDYRRRACEHSNEYNFRLTCRFFRAYLSACVSIIDAFINRHILLAEHDGFTSPEFEDLKMTTKLEERMRLWFDVCSDKDPAVFFDSIEWCHFQEIRKMRNEIQHAVEPIFVYVISDLQSYLNKVRTGVGGLLLRLRDAHQKPTLLFIERLRTAPLVDFCRIRFRADGNHQIKRTQGR